MAGATIAVYGIFYESALAKSSVEQLLAAHFAEADVTVQDPQILGNKDISHDRESTAGGSTAVVTSSVAIGGALGLHGRRWRLDEGGSLVTVHCHHTNAVSLACDVLHGSGAQAISQS